MIRFHPRFGMVSGTGDGGIVMRWPFEADRPEIVTPDAAAVGWLEDAILLTIDGALWRYSLPDWRPSRFADGGLNFGACGGRSWAVREYGVTRGQFKGGPLPTAVADWTPVDAGRDGALFFTLDGVGRVLWADGAREDLREAMSPRLAQPDTLIYLVGDTVKITRSLNSEGMKSYTEMPAQLEGAKGWPFMPKTGWIGYQMFDGRTGLVLHRTDDASKGYQWLDGASTGLYNVDGLVAPDGRCYIGASTGAGERPEDLRRWSVVLGEGMQTFAHFVPMPGVSEVARIGREFVFGWYQF